MPAQPFADEPRPRRGRPTQPGLTPAQERALTAFAAYLEAHSFPPTAREVAAALESSAANAHVLLGELVRKGYLARDPNKARGLRVVKFPLASPSSLIPVPLVGLVAAGYPVLSPENVEGEILVDSSVTRGHSCFALKVRGASMRDAGIPGGSIVVVRQQPVAESGDVVVASIDGQATVKRLVIKGASIELQPANPTFKPIAVLPDSELRIFGVVIAVRQTGRG